MTSFPPSPNDKRADAKFIGADMRAKLTAARIREGEAAYKQAKELGAVDKALALRIEAEIALNKFAEPKDRNAAVMNSMRIQGLIGNDGFEKFGMAFITRFIPEMIRILHEAGLSDERITAVMNDVSAVIDECMNPSGAAVE